MLKGIIFSIAYEWIDQILFYYEKDHNMAADGNVIVILNICGIL